jgi:ABC-2 type transport system permease protein
LREALAVADKKERPAAPGRDKAHAEHDLGEGHKAAGRGMAHGPADRKGGQGQRLLQLRKSRADAFRSEVFPYFRYVAQSGFGLLVSVVLLISVIQYVNWLNEFPAGVPLGLYGAAIVALAAVWSPFRTYFQPADTIFLLPMETEVLRHYIRPLLIGAARAGALRTLAVFAMFVPLYIRAPHTLDASSDRPLWLLAIAMAAIGAWNAWGAWQERRTADPLPRVLLRLARYAVTLASTWALLNAPLIPAIVFAAFSAALVALLGRLPPQQTLPWERLIREETRARLRWQRFLSWFVDLPVDEWRPARRRWAAWIGDRLPWGRRHVWQYLYAKTFIRSETFGAWLRWHGTIGLILLVSGHPAADWALLGIGVFAAGVQLSELGRLRFPPIIGTLPLPGEEEKRKGAARIARVAGAAGTLLLWLAAALPQQRPLSWTTLALLAACLLWSVWLVPRRLAKQREEDD